MKWTISLLVAGLMACHEKPVAPLSALAPKPLPRLEENVPSPVPAAVPVFGDALPGDAVSVALRGDLARLGPDGWDMRTQSEEVLRRVQGHAVLLMPDADTYLAQVSPLLEALDDAGVETWLAHPRRPVAYRLRLLDEAGFARWIAAPNPGNIRIIQRADGFELSTNLGKLPAFDPNGPSVPLRGGRLDLGGLRSALGKLHRRFDTAKDLCIAPSFGTELQRVAEALSADFIADGRPIFGDLCFVYPRSRWPDGG